MASAMLVLATVCFFSIAFTWEMQPVEGAAEGDRIKELPGQPAVNFAQFSGYVTVNQEHGRALFYYLVEAESDAESRPLVLWLNGGPGCSSLGGGGFSELGPFFPNGTGTGLRVNHQSWNQVANLLFLETPAGVGFSYSNTSADLENFTDARVAEDTLQFLVNWLEEFPEYKGRDFYITGESYAGHYIPDLATLVVNYSQVAGNYNFNLKGLAIGNPLFNLGVDGLSTQTFAWSHGIVSEQTYEVISSTCNFDDYDLTDPNYNETVTCAQALNASYDQIGDYIDPYYTIVDVCVPAAAQQEMVLFKKIAQSLTHKSLGIDVCITEEERIYLNLPEVQKALHVTAPNITWDLCNTKVLETYNQFEYKRDMIAVLMPLFKTGLRLLIYSGDQDLIIPLIGTRQLVLGLATSLGLNTTTPYTAWFVENQVGGWVQSFDSNNFLTYATVRGASHMVPYSQPVRSLVLFKSFLANTPLPTTPPYNVTT